jgi:hypothetical protein
MYVSFRLQRVKSIGPVLLVCCVRHAAGLCRHQIVRRAALNCLSGEVCSFLLKRLISLIRVGQNPECTLNFVLVRLFYKPVNSL